MIRISRMLRTAWLALLIAATPALSDTVLDESVFQTTSTGLITFSAEDKAIRVAAVVAARDDAVVPTLVRFLDAKSNVLKRVRRDLRDGEPIVAELTRRDVGARSDVLVRVEVVHQLALRPAPYPILVTTQPISLGGSARLVLTWRLPECGPPDSGGIMALCEPGMPTDFLN